MTSFDLLAPIVHIAIKSICGTLLPLLLCLIAFKLTIVPQLKGKLGEMIVAARLRRLGFPILNDVIIEATDGTLTQIDHIVLTARGLLAIEVKNYAGLVFGAANDSQWTQVRRRQKYRFQNPLRQNAKHIRALRLLGMPVSGLVVFAGSATFPKGLPAGVITVQEIGRLLNQFGLPDRSQEHEPAWQQLVEATAHRSLQRRDHLIGLRASFGPDPRLFVALGCVGTALVLALYFNLFRVP